MPVLNTYASNLQSKVAANVRTAIASVETDLSGDGSLSPETASALIFEMGQLLTFDDTDDQTGCAFHLYGACLAPRCVTPSAASRVWRPLFIL